MDRREQLIRILKAKKQHLEEDHKKKMDSLNYAISVIRDTDLNSEELKSIKRGWLAQSSNGSQDSMRVRIIECLKKYQRFLHNNEITKELFGEISNLTEIKIVKRRVTVALSYLKGKKVLVSVQIGRERKSTYWGLPDWLDVNNKIKSEHNIKFIPTIYTNLD